MRASDSDGEEGIRRKSPRRSSKDENRRLRFESETERVSVFVLLVVGIGVCVGVDPPPVPRVTDPDPDADLSRPLPEFGSTDARFAVEIRLRCHVRSGGGVVCNPSVDLVSSQDGTSSAIEANEST